MYANITDDGIVEGSCQRTLGRDDVIRERRVHKWGLNFMSEEKQEMREDTTQQNERHHEEKKYQFMREQIRPQGRHHIRKMARTGGIILLLGILFCGISVMTFYIMRRYWPVESFGAEVIYVTPSPEEKTEELTSIKHEDDTNTISLEQYANVSKSLLAQGDKVKNALVTLWLQADQDADISQISLCGVVFQQSNRGIFILAPNTYTSDEINAYNAYAEFSDGSQAQVTCMGQSSSRGIAVYRVNRSELSDEMKKKLVVASLGYKDTLKLGTPVIAVGKPNGVMYSVHTGMVTNNDLEISVTDGSVSVCTADIDYSDQSAGFIISIQGNLVGMITTSYTDQTGTFDMAFVQMDCLMHCTDNILQGNREIHMGVTGSAVNVAEAKELELEKGLYVQAVSVSSPAYQSGIRVADVITEIDGKAVNSASMLYQVLQSYKAGDTIIVTAYRKTPKGKKQKETIKVTLQ